MNHRRKEGYQPEHSEKPLHEEYQSSPSKRRVPLKPPLRPPDYIKTPLRDEGIYDEEAEAKFINDLEALEVVRLEIARLEALIDNDAYDVVRNDLVDGVAKLKASYIKRCEAIWRPILNRLKKNLLKLKL